MAFTKVLPAGISSATNLVIDSINSAGVVTATGIVASTGTFSGNVSIAGTLTYEDVTNIDSVGLSTFQNGIHVTGGNIGVNNTNPQSQLHVTNASSSTVSLMEDGASGADLVYDGSTNYFSIKTGTGGAGSQTTRLTIQRDNGNLGIGTDNPTDKLHVYSSNGNTISTIDSVGNDAGLQLRNSGNGNWSGINFIRERSTGTNVAGGSIWMPSVTANNSALLYIQTQTASANAGQSGALTDNNGVRLKLASQPNGVGADSAFSVEVGSQERLRVTSSGNIGIQTNNPYGKLHIGSAAVADAANDVDTTNTSLVIKQSTNNRDDGIYIERSGERRGYYMWINPGGGAGDALTFTRNNLGTKSNALILDRDANAHFGGEVGIGTDNPAAKLEVKSGKIRAGETGATNGSTILEGYYSGSNVLNILGSHYSNGATVLSYGMRPKNSSSGYVSSFANFSGGRTALEMWGDGAQIVTAPSQNTAVGSDLTSVTAAVKVNNNGDVTMRGTDSQYIEMASYKTSNGSDIVSNDDDYLEWTEISNTNPSVISHSSSPNPTRITFTVAGVVHFNTHQDIITSGSTSYAQLRIVKNGSIINRSLITNTGGQWNNFPITGVVEVSANDYLEISVQASDITGWDNSGWSSYNFIFAPINTDR